jgi:hypothetical protein
MNSVFSVRNRSWSAWSRRAMHLLGGLFAVLLLCLPAFSQGNSGRILGTVTDQSGGVVAGATVTVVDTQRGVNRTLITDDAGQYNAPNLTSGTYTVRVEAKGFKKLERQNVVLEIGKEVRIDLIVQPGEQEQTVTVTESVPLVETTNATLGGTINSQQVADLPLNGRNYQNLVNLRPGVQIYPGGGPWTQSTNGVRPDEMAYMVDGVINANFFDARPIANMPTPFADEGTIMPVDAIQDLDLEISPKAEYGWKPGATLNVGVKSGTNALHGAAYAFGRTESWDARNYFNIPASNGVCSVGLLPACDQTPAQLKQFGGVVGGPIKKDKLFFFAGYEGLRSLVGNAFGGNSPGTSGFATPDPTNSLVDAITAMQTAHIARSAVSEKLMGCTGDNPLNVTGTKFATTCGGAGDVVQNAPTTSAAYLSNFPNTATSNNGLAKIDFHINDKNTLNGLLYIGDDTSVGEDHPLVATTFLHPVRIRVWSNSEDWIWTPSSSLVNEVRFGYDRMSFIFGTADSNVRADGTGYPINTGVTNSLLGGLPTINVSGFDVLGGWNNRPQSQAPNPYFDVQENLSWLKGKHAMKYGVEITHIEADSAVYNQGRGQIYFNGSQTGGTALEDYLAGLPYKANLLSGNASRKLTWMSYAGFAQDDWHVTPKITVNLGLRYEYRAPMSEANGLLANFDPTSTTGLVQQGVGGLGTVWNPDRKDFGPRVGIAWDLSGKGTTVIRAGGSVMYTTMVAAWFTSQFGLQNAGSTSLSGNPTAANLFVNGVKTAGIGTIDLTSNTFGPGQLCWDAASASSCPAGVAQKTVFPSSASGPQCGDGVGADPGPCNLMAVDPNLKTPYVASWNIGVQHAILPNLSLEVGYVGNRGERLLGFRDLNQPVNGVTPYGAKFPYIGFINYQSNDAHSRYNSLQATLTQRTTHGLSFVAGYTYAHGLDNGSLNRFGLLPQDSYNPQLEYASSDFDIRHRFTLSTSYNIPGIKGFAQMLEGWQLNSIVTLQTGQPWNVFDTGNNFSQSGESADRWNFTGPASEFTSGKVSIPFCDGTSGNGSGDPAGGCTINTVYGPINLSGSQSMTLYTACKGAAADSTSVLSPGGPATGTLGAGGCYISTDGKSIMTPPALGKFGNMSRNPFRDSGFRNWDLSVFKNFTFKERFGAQFRAEFFNILNHPNIGNPYGSANGWNTGIDPSARSGFGFSGATPDGSAGNALLGSGSARDVQFGLKLTF